MWRKGEYSGNYRLRRCYVKVVGLEKKNSLKLGVLYLLQNFTWSFSLSFSQMSMCALHVCVAYVCLCIFIEL